MGPRNAESKRRAVTYSDLGCIAEENKDKPVKRARPRGETWVSQVGESSTVSQPQLQPLKSLNPSSSAVFEPINLEPDSNLPEDVNTQPPPLFDPSFPPPTTSSENPNDDPFSASVAPIDAQPDPPALQLFRRRHRSKSTNGTDLSKAQWKPLTESHFYEEPSRPTCDLYLRFRCNTCGENYNNNPLDSDSEDPAGPATESGSNSEDPAGPVTESGSNSKDPASVASIAESKSDLEDPAAASLVSESDSNSAKSKPAAIPVILKSKIYKCQHPMKEYMEGSIRTFSICSTSRCEYCHEEAVEIRAGLVECYGKHEWRVLFTEPSPQDGEENIDEWRFMRCTMNGDENVEWGVGYYG